jgi:hypothetical protein
MAPYEPHCGLRCDTFRRMHVSQLMIRPCFGGVIVNRRKFLHCLSSLPVASLAVPRRLPLGPNQNSRTNFGGYDSTNSRAQSLSDRSMRVGIVGVVGVGIYHLDRVAQRLEFPCKTIAIETNQDRLRWCHAQQVLLISAHGSGPTAVREAQLLGRERKSDLARLFSSLDVAFILTGLNWTAGKGVTSAVAETLEQLHIFTVAILPGRREVASVRFLQRRVDVLFEVPHDALINEARARKCRFESLVSEALGQTCRAIAHSLAQSESMDKAALRSLLMGTALPPSPTTAEPHRRLASSIRSGMK